MPLQIATVPCLSDNYAFIAHDEGSGATAVVDVPEAAPILQELDRRGWRVSEVLITHHHDDHVQGLGELLEAHPGAKVVGAKADAHRLPKLDLEVAEGDPVAVGGETGYVIDVSGHTVGHIAFHFPSSNAAFTADSLMALGCGRVFEGTFDQMWQSLSKLAALPEDTIVYSGHEYTKANAAFAMTIEPDNAALISRVRAVEAAREKGEPTVPSALSLELATNPFLRADRPEMREALGMEQAPANEIFAEIRKRKDNF